MDLCAVLGAACWFECVHGTMNTFTIIHLCASDLPILISGAAYLWSNPIPVKDHEACLRNYSGSKTEFDCWNPWPLTGIRLNIDIVTTSGVPRVGWGFNYPPPAPKFRRPSKIVQNSTRLWKLLKLLNLGSQHSKMFGKKAVNFYS